MTSRRRWRWNPKLPDVGIPYYGMSLASTGDTPGAAVAFRKELESNPNDYTANVAIRESCSASRIRITPRRAIASERALGVRPGDARPCGINWRLWTCRPADTGEARIELGEARTAEIPQFV